MLTVLIFFQTFNCLAFPLACWLSLSLILPTLAVTLRSLLLFFFRSLCFPLITLSIGRMPAVYLQLLELCAIITITLVFVMCLFGIETQKRGVVLITSGILFTGVSTIQGLFYIFFYVMKEKKVI